MITEHPTELLEAYALQLLSPETAAPISEHLLNCAMCQDSVQELEETLGQLAYAAPYQSPPPGMEERFFARFAAEKEENRTPVASTPKTAIARPARPQISTAVHPPLVATVRQPTRLWRVSISAVAAVLVIGLLGVWLAGGRATTTRLTLEQQAVAALNVPHPQVFQLASTSEGPHGAQAVMAMDATTYRGVLVVAHLPALAANHTYEFWLVQTDSAGQHTAPAGTFTVQRDGTALLRFKASTPETVQNAGISLELTGGVTTPDSPMLLLINA